MNRQHEIQAIEQHIQTHGVYRCKMGEMYYSEDRPRFNRNVWQTGPKKQRIIRDCKWCGDTMSLSPGQSDQIYCSRTCGANGTREKRKKGKYVPCDNCGNPVYRTPARQKKHAFCDEDCHKEWRRK